MQKRTMTLGLEFSKSHFSHNPASIIPPSTPSCTAPLCGAGGHQPQPLGHYTLPWRSRDPTGWWEFPTAQTGMCRHTQCPAHYPALSPLPGQDKEQLVGWMSFVCVWAHIKVNVWNNLFCRMLVKLTGCRGFGMMAKLTCSAEGPGSCVETGLGLLFPLILILDVNHKLSFVSLWLFRELVHQQKHN